MRRYLLPENGQFYKANLHAHTNLSDAFLSPEEVKAIYKEKGYSIVAYTDHELLFPQNHLADDTFLPLNGVELSINEEKPPKPGTRVCHLCCIAMEPDNHFTPCPHQWYYFANLPKNKHLAAAVPGTQDFPRPYSTAGINNLIAEVKKHGYFVTYNHPVWNLEDQSIYAAYTGMDAMEIYNHNSATSGYDEYNPQIYDFFLRQGKRIFCISADDNHNRPKECEAIGGWGNSFGGWVMIKAEQLEYRTITQAIANGQFYSSQGPEIHELWIDDNTLHIKCSPVQKIMLTTANRRSKAVFAHDNSGITEASFNVSMTDGYIRLTVTDLHGKPANTNAYFLDDYLQ